MKKILPIIVICVMLSIIVPMVTNAIEIENPLKYKTLTEVLNAVMNMIIIIGMGLATIMLVWSSILYITSGANDEKVTRARKNLLWTLVGLAILLAAKGIILIVQETLGQITK